MFTNAICLKPVTDLWSDFSMGGPYHLLKIVCQKLDEKAAPIQYVQPCLIIMIDSSRVYSFWQREGVWRGGVVLYVYVF